MQTHLEVVEIVTFSRVLGHKDNSGVDPGQVGLERIDGGRTDGTDVGSRVGSGIAMQTTSQLDMPNRTASTTYYRRKCSR